MKEHPDYKYRPRRKPKPLLQQKKESKYNDCPVDSVPFARNPFFPHHSFSETDFKLSRALFPSLRYPFYQPSKFHSTDSSNCKIPADFTLQALYGSSFYSQAAAAVAASWPTIPATHCGLSCISCTSGNEEICPKSPSPDRLSDTSNLKRPIACLVMKERENGFSLPSPHVIWKPLPVLPESATVRENLGSSFWPSTFGQYWSTPQLSLAGLQSLHETQTSPTDLSNWCAGWSTGQVYSAEQVIKNLETLKTLWLRILKFWWLLDYST